MKKILLAALLVFIILPMTGCGGSNNPPPPPTPVVASIISDPAFDGDIFDDKLLPPAFIVTQGMSLNPVVQSVFAGIDPDFGGEYRAFLHFNLDNIPLNAIIDSASLNLFVTSNISGWIPITIDLVTFDQPMIASDFDRILLPWLATINTNIFINQTNVAQSVSINVTSLMAEAQIPPPLADFQVRIICGAGLIEINDTTGINRNTLAPLLQVAYF